MISPYSKSIVEDPAPRERYTSRAHPHPILYKRKNAWLDEPPHPNSIRRPKRRRRPQFGWPGVTTGSLLLESGLHFLLESGEHLLLES